MFLKNNLKQIILKSVCAGKMKTKIRNPFVVIIKKLKSGAMKNKKDKRKNRKSWKKEIEME